MEASDDMSDYKEDTKHWLIFDSINNLLIEGGGTGNINGNGKIWWQNSCKINKTLVSLPPPPKISKYLLQVLFMLFLSLTNCLIIICFFPFIVLQPCKDAPTVG